MAGSARVVAGDQDSKEMQLLRPPRQRLRLALAVLGLVLAICVSSAFADEASQAPPLGPTLQDLEDALERHGPDTVDLQPTDPQAAEELPHRDLGREEAVELTEAVFEPILRSASGLFQDLEVEKYLSNTAAVVSADAQPESLAVVGGGSGSEEAEPPAESGGEETVLLESTVPLRTEDANGDMAPVDLELEASGDQLEPREPLVQVQLPQELGDGIQLPEAGIGIEVADAPSDRAPSVIDESVAAYPNIALDTDFSAVPTPTGLETYMTLRSAEAPHEQTLHLDLPPGAELNQDQGGAEVIQAGEVVLRVPPPFAVDANGASVPVSLMVSGDSLTIVASPGKDTAYPALVDPIFEAHDWFAAKDTFGQSSWHPKVVGSGMTASSGTWNEGMTVLASSGNHNAGDQAGLYYWVPRLKEEEALGRQPTSYIARMTIWHVGLKKWGPGSAEPYLFAGIWGGAEHWAGAPGHEAVWALSGNTPETWMDPGYEVRMENGEPGKRDQGAKVAWGIGVATATNTSNGGAREGVLGAASVEVADEGNPSAANGNVLPWVNQTAAGSITADAEDSGLGVKAVRFELPGIGVKNAMNSCQGIAAEPCPLHWAASLAANQYNPAQMPQGFDYIPVTAEDVVGNKSTPGAVKAIVRVDHTAPALALSGSIAEQEKLGTNASQYALKYGATDGDDEAAVALAPFGGAGTAEGKTQRPIGIAADGSGNVWVVDRDNNRVEKFDENGKFLMQFGGEGTGNGKFIKPNGIAISSAGNLWVADGGNHRVQQFNAKGEYLQQFGTGYTPGGPEGGTVFLEPYGVATTPEGMVWVSDLTGQRVGEYRENPASGRFVRNAYGSTSNAGGNPEFAKPAGLATDPQGNLWVVDCEHAKIKKFSPSGQFLMQFGAYGGTGNGQLYAALDIAVAPSGHILVTDSGNNRIEVFQPDGTYLRQFGTMGSGSGQFSDPRGVTFGANNTAFVADASNHRVARWTHTDQDPESGIAKVQIKVDGQVKATPYNQVCETRNCSYSNEWTYKSSEYTTGQHKVEVVAEDGVKLTTLKSMTISSVKDTVPPQLTTSGAFFEAPAGWVEQKGYSASATAKDPNGFGVTSLVFKIDGKELKGTSQSCPNGACEAALTGSISMAPYKGGAHTAEVIAIDGAGLVTKKAWTINVNPTGQISSAEAADVLEAVEATSPETVPIAPTAELIGAEERAEGNDPGLVQNGSLISSTGTPASSSMTTEPGEGMVIETAGDDVEIAPVASPVAPPTEVVQEVAVVSAGNGVDTIVRPKYNGLLAFQNIRKAEDPQTYSWEVSLSPGQTLKPIEGGTSAGVYFEDGTEMMLISAEPAHDATGKSVPTSLAVTGKNIVTLTVAHKSGQFVYPVVTGASYEVGYSTVEVITPPPPIQVEEEEAGVPVNGESDGGVTAEFWHNAPIPAPSSASLELLWTATPWKPLIAEWGFKKCQTYWCPIGFWEMHFKEAFFYNGREHVVGGEAWHDSGARTFKTCNKYSSTEPWSLSVNSCKWIGNHAPYGHGSYFCAQDEWHANNHVTSEYHAMTFHNYGDGYAGRKQNSDCSPAPY
jgi:sugar lactone lactonase YvrE